MCHPLRVFNQIRIWPYMELQRLLYYLSLRLFGRKIGDAASNSSPYVQGLQKPHFSTSLPQKKPPLARETLLSVS